MTIEPNLAITLHGRKCSTDGLGVFVSKLPCNFDRVQDQWRGPLIVNTGVIYHI